MDNDPKYTAKATQELMKAENGIFFNWQGAHLISTQQDIVFSYFRQN